MRNDRAARWMSDHARLALDGRATSPDGPRATPPRSVDDTVEASANWAMKALLFVKALSHSAGTMQRIRDKPIGCDIGQSAGTRHQRPDTLFLNQATLRGGFFHVQRVGRWRAGRWSAMARARRRHSASTELSARSQARGETRWKTRQRTFRSSASGITSKRQGLSRAHRRAGPSDHVKNDESPASRTALRRGHAILPAIPIGPHFRLRAASQPPGQRGLLHRPQPRR